MDGPVRTVSFSIGNSAPEDVSEESRRHAVACERRDQALTQTAPGLWVCDECGAACRDA